MNELSKRLREYRSRNEWGDPVQHLICDESADLIDTLTRERDELVKALEQATASLSECREWMGPSDTGKRADAALLLARGTIELNKPKDTP